MIALKSSSFTLLLAILFLTGHTQIENDTDNSDEKKILRDIIPVNYSDRPVKTLKFPQRKHDSPFFCDEIEEYKNGFIINSITSTRTGNSIEFNTNFYYINQSDFSIKKIKISNADTIESIVSTGKSLFYSFIKRGRRTVASLNENMIVDLTNKAPSDVKRHLDTAKWLKLGYYDNRLYVLSPNFLFQVERTEWKTLTSYSLDDYYTKTLRYRRSLSMLPTRNLVINKNSVYFLQEIGQERRCDLLKLNISDGTLEEYFTSINYKDNYLKLVNDFTFLSDNSLLVASSRLMYQNMLIKKDGNKVNVWSYNNLLTTTSNNKIEFSVSTISNVNDTLLFASHSGIYLRDTQAMKPLVYLNNYQQAIKEDIGIIHFEFIPRCVKRLSSNSYLLGGLYGGLYRIDVSKGTLICLDDISYERVKFVDITAL